MPGAARTSSSSELLGYGRDPRAPLLDAITTDGDVEVPIDAVGFGFWLKAAFGAPTSAGTVAATGAITFSVQPLVNSALTINGTVFTFVASDAVGNQANISANLAATTTALAVVLNANGSIQVLTFANAVTQVGMPQANLTAQLLGLGGATADANNRLSVNTPAVLLNNAGAGIEATVNKLAAGNDAAFAFKTGFSARALIGLLGSDDFTFKVSPDGSSVNEARPSRAPSAVKCG